MARPTFRSSVSRFRLVLLAVFVVCVGILGALLYFGQEGKERPKKQLGNASGLEEGMKLAGRQFDYTFSNRERPVFHIKGDSVSMDQEETVYLEKVGLTLWDSQGNKWDCTSDAGSLNQTSKEGRLWGNVVVEGPHDIELHTTQLQIKDKGNLVMTPRAARIFYGGKYFIRTDSLQAWLPDEVYSLVGDLEIVSLPDVVPPVALSADHGVYERKHRQIRVEKNAELHHGKDVIRADKLSAMLSEDESSLTFVRALWHVVGETYSTPKPQQTPTVVHFTGNDLAVLLTHVGNQVQHVDLVGDEQARAFIESKTGELTRTLTAPRIEGDLADNVLSAARAYEGVDIHETGPPPPQKARPAKAPASAKPAVTPAVARGDHAAGGVALAAEHTGPDRPAGKGHEEPPKPIDRKAHGKRGEATFRADGQLATVSLLDDVTYDDGDVKAKGNRAQMDLEAGRGEFFGSPVDAESNRGTMRAPHVTYTSADELMHADQGVRAVLKQADDQALAAGPLATGKGPITVEAVEGYWRRNPSSFQFRTDVRAWRDENLLLAPEVNGDRLDTGDQLTAGGGVKTVWVPDEKDGAAGSKARKPTSPQPKRPARATGNPPPPGSNDLAKHGPVTVTATNLLYRDGARWLTYTGNVHIDQDAKTIDCQQLDVELDQDKKAKTMTCTGSAHLVDPAAGRTVDGDKAVYKVAQRKIDVTGDIVTLHDKDGSVVHGQHVIYFVDDGKAQVQGKDPTLNTQPPAPGQAPAATGTPAKPPAPPSPPVAPPPTATPPPATPPPRRGGA